ncbi:EF-hand calcium-binding domain-containing protein 6-like [Discoglossus pictus]
MAGPNAKSLSRIHSKLPGIKHPVLLLGDPETLSVRGVSRASGRKEGPDVSQGSCKQETFLETTLKNYRTEQLDTWKNIDHWVNLDKKYWERDGKEDKGENLNYVSPQLGLQCEELEYQLDEKINSGGFYNLKHLFFSNDPENRGRVTRDVLLVILTTFLGRYISCQHFDHLLQRLHLGGKQVITFDAFYEYFKKTENNDPPEWLDPLKRKQKPIMKTAHQVHLDLKEFANTRYFELLKLFPKDALKYSEFRNVLSKFGMVMTDKEYDKLWDRYATVGNGSLGIEDLLCALGIKSARDVEMHRSLLLSGLQKVSGSQQTQQPKTTKNAASKMGSERKLSLSIEKWLKEKFREGAQDMHREFLVYDPEKHGQVSKQDFLSVLAKLQLHITVDQLGHFLARCGLDETSPNVNYVEFLQRLQSRSKAGLAHKVLYQQDHRLEKRSSPRSEGPSRVLEDKLLKLFHADFASLLKSFQKVDTRQQNRISQQDFRAILETRYCIKISDEEFECLLNTLPVDSHGGIRYLEFMDRFDSSSEWGLSIFNDGKTVVTEYSRKPNLKKKNYNEKKGRQKERTIEELTQIIKNIVKQNYGSLESAFNQVDDMNTRRLTMGSMYQLLKRFDTQISREEVGKLWRTFLLNQDETVDYYHFVRHFGFSTKSSCFPNAKISPPVQGDVDFMIRSKKLNSDTKIIANILQRKVLLLLDDLWLQFKELDPSNSGCITTEEFTDILLDLSPDLTQHQLESLTDKFRSGQDRVSYIKFLQPYKAQRSTYKHNNIKEPKPVAKIPLARENVQNGLNQITSKLRQKISVTEWKNLLQACQKLDRDGSGFLLLPEFRSVVKLCNVVLDEDDIFRIMSHYDKDLAGKIDYSKLVSDHNKSN